ncbi:MAG: dihydropteroate synthase [Nocardioidaceae bacterium]
MGVVNVTPDSFSDGGRWFEPDAAVLHGNDLLRQGADLVDVGGESTRPGAERPSVEEELARVMPVIEALAHADALVTIDTMRAIVARQAVGAGAVAINDVSGGLADDDMLATAAELEVPFIGMHWRGHAASMQERATYDDVVADVCDELSSRVEAALAAGVRGDRLALDPGLGFAKTGEHNWTLLRRLAELHALGHPIVVGASRKAFLGALLADQHGAARPAVDRDDASAALSALAALSGAWCVRVHEVRGSRDAVLVAARYGQESGSR